MQTFLPYPSFKESAKVLDRRRLGKQRVETLQILQTLLVPTPKKSWKNHPAVKMWKGHEYLLLIYQNHICDEWISRGYKDTCKQKSKEIFSSFIDQLTTEEEIIQHYRIPEWFGDERLHSSHRSNLLRKDLEHYSQFNWTEPSTLAYFWPV